MKKTTKIRNRPMPDFVNRPFSWSQMSSFFYDREQWWHKYCLHGKCTKEKCAVKIKGRIKLLCPLSVTSPEMEFGKMIGKKLETDPSFLPCVPRQSRMEFEFKVRFGKVNLIGYGDSFCDVTFRALEEYKTGRNAWTQMRVDSHGQFTFYAFMNWLERKIKPEEIAMRLTWMPTWKDEHGIVRFLEPIEKRIKSFATKRTTVEMLRFGNLINDTISSMIEYATYHESIESMVERAE